MIAVPKSVLGSAANVVEQELQAKTVNQLKPLMFGFCQDSEQKDKRRTIKFKFKARMQNDKLQTRTKCLT